ncbi:hypothetical protein [Streptomyces sp. NPDC018957]|uniref:hypothetical protein n=1 Tax=unclassified Streptomyces TaxID=2593676 RepID=UPI0037B941E3
MNSYAHGAGPTALLGDTIGANLDRAVASWPDREALADVPSGRRWTYVQFAADVDGLACALLTSGVARRPPRPSTRAAGCTPGTWPSCGRTATSRSSAASRT